MSNRLFPNPEYFLKGNYNHMINRKLLYSFFFLTCLLFNHLNAQIYPDQNFVLRIDSIKAKIVYSEGIKLSDDGKSIALQDNSLEGYFILKEQSSPNPFNQGLPSWNGKANGDCGFKVQMRFPYNNDWSPWLTVGYWQKNIWADYGSTSYTGGYIDYDNVKLNSYQTKWQFKVILSRTLLSSVSPTIYKLGFYVSDSRTTSNVNISQIVNDNPSAIFIPTSFIYQIGVDSKIGPDICSPTTVSMILRSYNISVDPYQFALSTYDPYFKMFGIWPRVVQNAAEFGLDGSVTRYRTWSEAKKILENGGRIAMSIGQPLYTGHLLMLAGFTIDGKPIVHDPAKSYGQSYVYDKTSLSQAWFNKGGVAYTFYPTSNIVAVENSVLPSSFELFQNYPNPFNPTTTIKYQINSSEFVSLKVFDALGQEIITLVNENKLPGIYSVRFDGSNLSGGVYFYRLQAGSFYQTKKLVLLK